MEAVHGLMIVRWTSFVGRLILMIRQGARLSLMSIARCDRWRQLGEITGHLVALVAQLALILQALQPRLQIALLMLKLRDFIQYLILILKTLQLGLEVALLPLELAQLLGDHVEALLVLQLLLLLKRIRFLVLALQRILQALRLTLAVGEQTGGSDVALTVAVNDVIDLFDRFADVGLAKIGDHGQYRLRVQFRLAKGRILVAKIRTGPLRRSGTGHRSEVHHGTRDGLLIEILPREFHVLRQVGAHVSQVSTLLHYSALADVGNGLKGRLGHPRVFPIVRWVNRSEVSPLLRRITRTRTRREHRGSLHHAPLVLLPLALFRPDRQLLPGLFKVLADERRTFLPGAVTGRLAYRHERHG